MTEGVVKDPKFAKTIESKSPMGRAGMSGELGTTILYLASDASTFVTGQIITVDCGWTVV